MSLDFKNRRKEERFGQYEEDEGSFRRNGS